MNLLWIFLWLGVVVAGIAAMQWGSARVCALLGTLRRYWGLPATAGGALMGLATASPEISVNVASVAFGWPDLGLGAALGSNVPALPLIFVIAYASNYWARRAEAKQARPSATEEPPPPRVQPQAVDVQVLPYLLILLLLAGLTLPPRWAGLQPLDGLLLAAAFALYFLNALRREREVDPCSVSRSEIWRALTGLPVIALGALASVTAGRHLNEALGFPDLIGGLFVIGLLCALPESFAAWRLAREKKVTTAVSGAVADGIVSLTLALIPPALVGAAVGNVAVYGINLAFLGSVLIIYIALNHYRRGQELGLGRVSLFGAGYGAYLIATVVVLTRTGAH